MALFQKKAPHNKKFTTHFKEANVGFSRKQALNEARRFPQISDQAKCPHCPLGVDIAGFIRVLREGDMAGAMNKIHEENLFPGICGRLCHAPCENQLVDKSEKYKIRALERYASDTARVKLFAKKILKDDMPKVAIVGSGPAGLFLAARLAMENLAVTVFEGLPWIGGRLFLRIPEFRFPKKILDEYVSNLEHGGVEFVTDYSISDAQGVDVLFKQGFRAVVLSGGLSEIKLNDFPGIGARDVFFAEEVLLKMNTLKSVHFNENMGAYLGERVLVLGSSEAALDCARSCVRLGKDIHLVVEGTEEDFLIHDDDKSFAFKEGIKIETMLKPLEIIFDSSRVAKGVKCIQLDYADPKNTGEWVLAPVPETEKTLEADSIVLAYSKRSISKKAFVKFDIRQDKDGDVWMDPTKRLTSRKGLFALPQNVLNDEKIVFSFSAAKELAPFIKEYVV